jgi:hypothetical protein
MKKHFLFILSIIVIGSLLISALFHTGWYTSHDGVYHILRTEEALRMLKLGQFPLRWAGTLDQGFGIPLWSFIYPLPYYAAAALSYFIGAVWAVKSVVVISYLMGGVGIYFLLGSKNKWVGMTLAVLYLATPYQFLNIFVRGALGEIMAMGLIPWVLLSFTNLIDDTATFKWYHPIPLALLLVAHNFLGILFGIFLVGYTIFQKKHKRNASISLLYSLGLAAFFLLPMILERSYLYSLDRQFFTFRFDQHFVYAKQLLYSKWDYWYSVPGDTDGMSFQLGIAQIVLSGLGILAIIFSKKRSLAQLYLVIAYLGTVFLMTSKSFILWDRISILQTVQFPWRLLFMTAILSPLLGYLFILRIKSKKVVVFFLCIMLALSFWNIRNYRRPMKQLTESEYTDLYLLNLGKSTTTFRTEILPKWSVPDERYKSEELLVNSGNMTIDSLETNPLAVKTTINNKLDESIGRITILRNYYPGWVAIMDGKTKIELSPTEEGMISLKPELGVHLYTVKMTSTLIEKIANAITLISVFALGFIWRKSRTQK